ncbi:hypothetical protein SAMN04488239_12338 [Ruegeria marina]|uniref:Lipoprotein n=2 Tax=Ruegeria marina TaxID=639004 RepID=A0A1G7E2G7_9RHOB|nr:hypothetical protein SAMN04488239_12338 [Ruegeria marina]
MKPRCISVRAVRATCLSLICLGLSGVAAAATVSCKAPSAREISARPERAAPGSTVMKRIGEAAGPIRDRAIVSEVLQGNVPSFMNKLVPLTLRGTASTGRAISVTLCVTPEYLAIGNDRDFVRVPLGLPAAAYLATELGFLLPTTKIVDAIYQQAAVRVAPNPMDPTSQMTTTSYFVAHNRTVEQQMSGARGSKDGLSAGHKKDLVLSNRLRAKPGRVAIYGWHRQNGKPIQPLSTVHGSEYADYSHGVRLVSSIAYVDGNPMTLDQIMRDRELSKLVSSEGPIEDANGLLRSYARIALN